MRDVIKWIWQLPQHLLALLLIVILRPKKELYFKHSYAQDFASFSLGNYIFLKSCYVSNYRVYMHECGHSKQSLLLGPLYLILIGLPSAIGNLLHRVWYFNYYKQPWEAWADKLGGVIR